MNTQKINAKELSNYRAQGNDYLIHFVETEEDLLALRGRLIVVGAGTNFLFIKKQSETDKFVSLKKLMNSGRPARISFDGNTVIASAGVALPTIISLAKMKKLGGLEFTYPVPASIGGAVFQNFGAYGKEISNYVSTVRAYNAISGKFVDFDVAKDKYFSYRDSYFKKHNLVITKVSLILEQSDSESIKNILKELSKKRKEIYPNAKTCGSVFKNGENYFAGKLLEDSGFKGYRQGNAFTSTKHANVVLGNEQATSMEIYKLIQHMKQKVYNDFQIELEEELTIY